MVGMKIILRFSNAESSLQLAVNSWQYAVDKNQDLRRQDTKKQDTKWIYDLVMSTEYRVTSNEHRVAYIEVG